MILSELFTNNSLPTWHDRSQDGFSIIDAEFQQGNGLLIVRFKRFRPDPEWTLSFIRDGEIKMINAGKPFDVMSKVLLSIREFIHTRRPNGLTFSADLSEPSRVSLYQKLFTKLESEFPEYERNIRKSFRSMIFTLERNGGPEPIEKEYLGEPVTGEEEKYRNRPLTAKQREEMDRIFAELGDLMESNPWSNLPKFYHGTTSRNLPSILRYGLMPQDNPSSYLRGNNSTIVGYTEKNVYLTTERKVAEDYARVQARHDGRNGIDSHGVVLEVTIPDSNKLLPDDDYINLHGHFHMWNQLSKQEKAERYSSNYVPPRFGGSVADIAAERAANRPFTQSIDYNKSVAYHGRIPAKFIKVLGSLNENRDMLTEYLNLTVKERLLVMFKEKGYKRIGSGAFAAVFSNGNNVIKVYREDGAYDDFLSMVANNPNKHFPKIVSKSIIKGTNLNMVRMEKLLPLTRSEYLHIWHVYLRTLGFHNTNSSFGLDTKDQEEFDNNPELVKAFMLVKDNIRTDLHGENMMKRPDGTIVITDPWAGARLSVEERPLEEKWERTLDSGADVYRNPSKREIAKVIKEWGGYARLSFTRTGDILVFGPSFTTHDDVWLDYKNEIDAEYPTAFVEQSKNGFRLLFHHAYRYDVSYFKSIENDLRTNPNLLRIFGTSYFDIILELDDEMVNLFHVT